MTTIQKTAYITLTLALMAVFYAPSLALGYFSGDAEAEENSFTAGTVEFTTNEGSTNGDISLLSTAEVDFSITDESTIGTQFAVSAEASVCTPVFFEGIDVVAELDGVEQYSGTLHEMYATSTEEGDWTFELSASSTLMAAEDEECEITFTIHAWQDLFPTYGVAGFSAEEEVEVTLTASEFIGQTVVLNEIMPNPGPDNTLNGPNGEWVELYNNSSQQLDLANWYVIDEGGHQRLIGGVADGDPTTENGTTTIEAYGWLVVYMNAEVLNNTGEETVYLYDDSGTLRDRYTYDAGDDSGDDPADGDTPNADNGSVTTGPAVSAQEGKSDARIPDGMGSWVDPEPTAGEPNHVTREELEALDYPKPMIDLLLDRQEAAQEAREAREAARKAAEKEAVEQQVVVPETKPQASSGEEESQTGGSEPENGKPEDDGSETGDGGDTSNDPPEGDAENDVQDNDDENAEDEAVNEQNEEEEEQKENDPSDTQKPEKETAADDADESDTDEQGGEDDSDANESSDEGSDDSQGDSDGDAGGGDSAAGSNPNES